MKYFLLSFAFLVPVLASAQFAPTDFRSLVTLFLRFIDIFIVLIFALTFIVLIWGIVKAWIMNPGNETEIEKGKNMAIYGVLVLVVMSGIWGILAILRASLLGI